MVERSSLEIRRPLLPPVVRCEYTAPTGTATRTTYVPWQEWGSIVLFALAMICWALALTKARHRLVATYCGSVSLLAAVTIWINDIATVVSATALVLPAIVWLLWTERSSVMSAGQH
jgi:hypothetical protein